MARTNYNLAGVDVDLSGFQWPLYRGAMVREVPLVLSLARYDALARAIKSRKGIVDLKITCTKTRGKAGAKETRTIKGIRVIELVKRTDRTCFLRLADARAELSRYIAKANLNLRFRDGYIDGTEARKLSEAFRKLLGPESLSLFRDGAFDKVPDRDVEDNKLTAGYARPKTLDELCSLFGVDIACDWEGKLHFATREDVGAQPLKRQDHPWILGKRPGWETAARIKYRLPQKLKYYYLRRHMMVVPIVQDSATVSTVNALTMVAVQVYRIEDKYYTLSELLVHFGASASAIDDATIARVFMSENFEGTAIARNGSENRDQLIGIIKRDWRRLFRLENPDDKGAFGSLSDLAVGVFTKAEADDIQRGVKAGDITQDISSDGGVRGRWVEFLNVLSGIGPDSIHSLSYVVNHNVQPPLPVTPFDGLMDEHAGVVRLTQQRLPDDNFAMPGSCSNAADMTVRWIPRRTVQDENGNDVPTRWGIDVPSRAEAKLAIEPLFLILCGTQRWPNEADMFDSRTLDGWDDGGVDVQEFEVPELMSLWDFVDIDAKIDGTVHPAAPGGMGQALNDDVILRDAEQRAEAFRAEMGRSFEGAGVAAGLSIMDEEIGGSVDELELAFQQVAVYGTARCDNIATEESRRERARKRAMARMAKVGGREVA